MKVLLYLVFSISGIFCELPPPYTSRGFRPSPQLSLPQRNRVPNLQSAAKQVQTKYGPPPSNAEPLDPSFQEQFPPIKFTLENSGNNGYSTLPKIVHSQPQVSYGPPPLQRQNSFQSVPQPSAIYGAPPQNNFQGGAQPQTTYGPPEKQQIPQRITQSSIDIATLQEIQELKQLLQKIQAQRINQQRETQYAAPQFSSQQNSVFKSQESNNGFVQHLPKQDASSFRSLSNQYLPVKEPENFKKYVFPTFNPQESASNNFGGNLDQNVPFRRDQGTPNNYIPPNQNNGPSTVSPTSSWNSLDLPNINNGNAQPANAFPNSVPGVDVQKVEVTQFGPRNRNRNNNAGVGTTYRPPGDDLGTNEGRNEGDVSNRYIPPAVQNPVLRRPVSTTQTPFESSPSEPNYSTVEGDNAENPNVAVAVAGVQPQDGQQFYWLKPDGTYQRVVLQKELRQEEKYTPFNTKYILQNLQANPNIVYTPFIGLGRR